MFIANDKALYIDIRSSAEVMLYGPKKGVDAHIPYLGGPLDEWNVFLQSYRSYTNNSFINDVFDLLCEFDLYRDSSIVLIAKSKRRGLIAESILNIAGYSNVTIKEYSGYSDVRVISQREEELKKECTLDGLTDTVTYGRESAVLVH